MDDDLTFGTSVWDSNDPVFPPSNKAIISLAPPLPAHTNSTDQFDDFDDFGPPAPTTTTEESEDFGDFGDFGEVQEANVQDFNHEVFADEVPAPGPSYEPLKLDPMPSRADLINQVNNILGPIWGDVDISQVTTREGIRQVEGIGQILDTPESRNLYHSLVQIPDIKPPNWKQSRIRRQHLIALGIPVNLDEVLPHANGKPLPPLQITTRPMSTPPTSKNGQHLGSAPGSSQAGSPRNDTPRSRFGPKPELDERKISELLDFTPESLTLLPPATLESRLADIRTQTAQTSALLKYLLQSREALQQDSEAYNKLIAELVGEAQKIKTGKGRPGGKR